MEGVLVIAIGLSVDLNGYPSAGLGLLLPLLLMSMGDGEV